MPENEGGMKLQEIQLPCLRQQGGLRRSHHHGTFFGDSWTRAGSRSDPSCARSLPWAWRSWVTELTRDMEAVLQEETTKLTWCSKKQAARRFYGYRGGL